MNRRQWLSMCAAALALVRWPRLARAQDRVFEQAVDAALVEFGGVTSATARIAPLTEPGKPLRIRGTLVGPDGRTPLGKALVFAYHTDREGLYNKAGATHSWRLRGAVRTAADGTFEFNTIRPASYPQTRIAQHVHVILQTADGRFHAGEWRFADDPMIDAGERARSDAAGAFGWVRPVAAEGGIDTIRVTTRVDPSKRFA
jgi:protocatechuate 3,4-dioxygenase beta subunit